VDEHPNARLVRGLFAAFHARDLAAIRAAVPEDAVWHFPGRSGQLAGTHAGRDAILGFLARVAALTGGSFRLELDDVVANDRTAVALFRGRAERNGRMLDNPTCLRLRIEDGRIRELHEFVWDLHAVEAFWA
jgi:ketosteroid isomerase-like protein